MTQPPDGSDPTAFEREFLEWVAAEVEARMVRSLPLAEREEAMRTFREALGHVLSATPLPAGASAGRMLAEIADRARIAAAFGATYGDDPPD